MWRASTPDPADVERFRAVRERFDLRPLVIHVNYLVNLATLDPVIRERSVASFRGELDRAAAIGAEYLVLHPGNYKGQSLEQGLAAFVLGLAEAAQGFKAPGVTVAARKHGGQRMPDRLALRRTARHSRSGRARDGSADCLLPRHLPSAGIRLRRREQSGLARTVASADRVLGLDLVRVIHANDSKGALGSHLDRHENIGQGKIGEKGFRGILTHPALREKPFILETPVDEEGDDQRNVDALKRLAAMRRL